MAEKSPYVLVSVFKEDAKAQDVAMPQAQLLQSLTTGMQKEI